MQKVLFVCTHNSARSQMAEAILRAKYGDFFEVFSAGTNPTQLNPLVMKIMTEIGIDMSNHESKHIELFLDQEVDIVVTVCDSAKENCPFFPGAKHYMHRSFSDPSQFFGSDEEILNNVRLVRNEIVEWIEEEFREIRKDQNSMKLKLNTEKE
ncbi:MAG: arsenate reductase ArsC [Candidatus Heimdallarchaeota archaeon]|nr:MAG: arsenate reductase ArsC [Candidatus Heimdallarchaeota archaeon]